MTSKQRDLLSAARPYFSEEARSTLSLISRQAGHTTSFSGIIALYEEIMTVLLKEIGRLGETQKPS